MSATISAAKEKIAAVQGEAERWSAEDILRWGLAEFSPHAAIASSFGAEDVAMIDIAARVRPDIRVFTLDTDFLFAETYELIDQLEKKYGIRVERVKSLLTPEKQAELHGPKLWTIAIRIGVGSLNKTVKAVILIVGMISIAIDDGR